MEVLTPYQKNKDAIYRWRNKNKDKYLLGLSVYFYTKMQNPEQRKLQYEKLKQNKLKKEIEQGIIKRPIGRDLESIILVLYKYTVILF